MRRLDEWKQLELELPLIRYINREFAKNLLSGKTCGNCTRLKLDSCSIHLEDAYTCLRWERSNGK